MADDESQNCEIYDLEKSVSGWIIDPWVVVWTADARLQVDSFPGQFLACQFARVWHPAGGLPFHCTLLPPGLEILYLRNGSGILDPLYNLCHSYKVNVIVVRQNLVYPVQKGVKKFGIVLEPGCMEVKS